MAKRNPIQKLILGPSDPVTRRTSLQGLAVIADYIDPANNQRTLVLERQGDPVRKERKKVTKEREKVPVAPTEGNQ